MRARCLVLFGLLGVLSLAISSAGAEIPQVINYQGKVTDSGGTPVADGAYSMTFSIYDASTGGSSLWSSGAVSVTVSGGVFSVLLGESPQPALSLDFSADYWVETSIEGDLQSPRARLGSVGYAYMASGLVAGTEVAGSVGSGNLAALSGTNTSTESAARGLYGSVSSATGRGVEGVATSSTGTAFGGRFESQSEAGRGVLGHASATTGTTYGVRGTCSSTAGTAVYGRALATEGTTYGVYGETDSTDGYAGYFAGTTRVTGDLTVDGSLNASGLGDITAVTAGTGLDGGGTTGDVTLSVEVPLSLTSTSTHTIQGTNTATTGSRYGLYGETASASGHGVYGSATATSGTTYGIFGVCSSPSGYAGYFQGNSRVTGNLTVDGTLSAPGLGDITAVTAGTGLTGGGTSGSVTLNVAVPLSLTGSNVNAIVAGTNSGAGSGISGVQTATTGEHYGVYGQSNSTAGYAGYFDGNARVTGNMTVDGTLSAPGLGDITAVTAGTGLTGGGTSGAVTLNVAVPLSLSTTVNGAVIGGTNASTGSMAFGLSGLNTATSGLTCGVYGVSASTDGSGVYGGTTATTGATWGVNGQSRSPSGYGVYFSGGLAGTGTKSCVVKTSKGPTLMYCQESPENWFEDFGEGQLVDGRCHIELDPLFLETVTVDGANPMQVFLQPYHASCAGLVVERGATGFDVYNPLDPLATGGFGYRVVAKRKGFEAKRLDYCAAGERDSYLYPELREKELREMGVRQ